MPLTSEQLRARLEIVDGLLRALDERVVIDEAVAVSVDRPDALRRLMGPGFGYTEIQAHHILDTTLGRRTQLGHMELQRERDRLAGELRALD